ncbi:hypothetical protein [Myroides sp. TSA_177.3]|uniref:hypothetical protein n=1 Tax=Myroides sp. TSA_177.3 TaxID=3415650 RepID=UPI0040451CBB
MKGYEIVKEGEGTYIFVTDNNIEYQLETKRSGIVYEDFQGECKDIIELALNCDINTASKDYKTTLTLANFFEGLASSHDAIYLQIHNQPEHLYEDKVQRRGLSRLKLWNREISKFFKNHIMLNNLVLNPNKSSDILSIIIKKDSIYYNQFVIKFYRFCYFKMYKDIS